MKINKLIIKKRNLKLVAYRTIFTTYGVVTTKNYKRYKLEVNTPIIRKAIKLWNKPNKPKFKNIIVISLLWLPFYFMLWFVFVICLFIAFEIGSVLVIFKIMYEIIKNNKL